MSLLKQLRRDGFKVSLGTGDKIIIKPVEKVTPEILEMAKRNKLELLKELSQGKRINNMVDMKEYKKKRGWLFGALVRNMSYDKIYREFVKELAYQDGLILFGEIAITTPDRFEEAKKLGYVPYTPDEFVNLYKAGQETWRAVHELKKAFDGKVSAIRRLEAKGKVG